MGRGVLVALASGFAFAMSGPFGKPLLEAGWSPSAAVLVRLWIAALVTAVPMALFARDRLATLRRAPLTVLGYGLLAVLAVQLAYFNAVSHMSVTVSLLIEFSAPVLVLFWLWGRHGKRPSPVTSAGAVVAVGGLLAVVGGAGGGAVVTPVGLAWAGLSLVGLACYFLLADDGAGDGPRVDQLALAAGGLVIGAVTLTVLGAARVVPIRMSTADVTLGNLGVAPWWVPALVIGAFATGLAYVAGILAINMIGPTLASFLAFSEVVASTVVAWLMLGEALTALQIGGAVAIVLGVLAVKRGEVAPDDDADGVAQARRARADRAADQSTRSTSYSTRA